MNPIDFGSGLAADNDLALLAPFPADPAASETMNFWAYDAARNIGVNIHPRLSAGEMHVGVTVFLSDGSILRCRSDSGRFDDPRSPASERVAYRCLEPFTRWSYRASALPAFRTSDSEQRQGTVADETLTEAMDFELVAEAAAPVWRNGTLTREARQMMEGPAGLWIAGRVTAGLHPESFRYDQLVRVSGTVAGERFQGVGLRSHVRGVRDLVGMAGTCWMSGLFPSGAGFGVMVNIGADGRYRFSEAYTTDGEALTPARILQFPRRHRDLDEGRFWVQLANDVHGLIDIAGEDVRAFYWSMPAWGAAVPPAYGRDASAGVVMKQALARYEWNGETGYGLNERSGA